MKSLLIGLALAAPVWAHADEAAICPASIQTQQSAPKVPYPFIAVAAKTTTSQLKGLTFFDGDPKDQASLAPDSENKVGGQIVSTWTFPPGNERPTYVRCLYEDTSVVLQRTLDAKITSCKVTLDEKEEVSGYPAIRRIDCK